MSSLRRTLLPLALLATAACGGDPFAESQVYDELAAAYCDVLSSCAIDSIIPYRAMAEADPAGCRENVALVLRQRDPERNLEVAVRRGRVRLDPEALPACLAGIGERCTNRHDQVQACREAFVGTVALGGACTLSDECAGDAFCEGARADGCPGTCTPRQPRGAGCTYVDDECSAVEGPSLCRGGTCDEWPALGFGEGEYCGSPGFVGYSEWWSGASPCAAGLHCIDDHCRRGAALGEPCDAAPCDSGLVCVPTDDGPRCAREIIATAVGATCNPGDPALPPVTCDALAGLVCVEGRCAAAGDGREGNPCRRPVDVVDDLFGSGRRCEPGTICDATETCVAHIPGAVGAPCGSAEECISRQCDDGFCLPSVCPR